MLSSSSMASSVAAVVLALMMATPAVALDGAQTPTLMGCYASSQGLTYNDTVINQSSGHCQIECFTQKKAVMAMVNGKDCWCGDNMPPLTAKVDSSSCDTPCAGYPPEICGSSPGASNSYYSVWNSGLNSKVYNLENSTSSSSSPTSTPTSTPAAASTAALGTVVITASASPSTSSSPSSGPSTAGIAAGVVVGIIAIAAIAGGIWFYMRAKRRRELEEEHKRQAAVTAFVNAGKPNSSAGSSHDTRLDPIMTQRRMSDGSIADNQDYSRRILKVTNA